MGATHFRSQVVPQDSTEKIGKLTWGPWDLVHIVTEAAPPTFSSLSGATGFLKQDNQYMGMGAANAGVIGPAPFVPPIDWDVSAATTFYIHATLADAVTTNDAIAFALAYDNLTDNITTVGTDGTAISALPATTTGVTNAGTLTVDHASNWDDKLVTVGPFTIAAATFSSIPTLLAFGFTATLTTMSANEFLVYAIEMRYTRRFV